MTWLLDTCVVSELVKPKPKASVVHWLQQYPEQDFYLSVVTLGELEKGIAKLLTSPKRKALEVWVRREIPDRFGDRLLVIDSIVASRWGEMVGESEQRGVPLPVIDSLIAATSLQYDLTVVTRNIADFQR